MNGSRGWNWPAFSWFPLEQPINPGWTFGNLSINNINSSSPDVEGAVVAQHSYGRQLGRISEALGALIEQAGLGEDARCKPFLDLQRDIEAIKERTRRAQFERLEAELEALQKRDYEAWKELRGRLDRRR